MARESASEACIRCPARSWKTAALLYEGLVWKYYYCYECRGWFKRHYQYRYAVAPVNDTEETIRLVKQLELQRSFFEANLGSISWLRSAASAMRRLVNWGLPTREPV